MNMLISALEKFKKASFELEEQLDRYSEEQLEKHSKLVYFAEDYPFDKSFDELILDIFTWVETQENIIKGENTK